MASEKVVVEEVPNWLRVYDDGSVDRTWTGPTQAKFLVTPVPPSETFIDGVATRDVVINPHSDLSVRIYVPEEKCNDGVRLPVLLHFHGGGFCVTQADWYIYHQFYTKLIASAPAICVSVNLRLAPGHRLPAAIDDGYAALSWLRSLARAELSEPWLGTRADFSRVFLMGDSSGGNVVHGVAARAGKEDLELLRLAGGVPVHPGFVRAERSRSELEFPGSAFLTLEMIDKFLALALPVGSNKDHPITCPMGPMAPPIGGLRLPPFLVAVAERDLMRDTQLEYVAEMKRSGKDVNLVFSPGMDHCFHLNKIAIDSDPNMAIQTDMLITAVSEFIRMH
ncbi:probable carboxylesterase 15 [Magnolia sinica]|uniref:probable carboxylesterase 15 n=1 Tax=Magnolia sinica TaxID=86752 RepID=UPI002658FBAC|nr:probable carboxylesterase 15 [Magnolia sinica]